MLWYFKIAFSVFFAAIATVEFAQGQENRGLPSSKTSIGDVNAAWDNRTAAITSMSLTCEIETTVIGRGDKPLEANSLFSMARPKNDRVLKSTEEYAFEKGKIAIKGSANVINPNNPETIRRQVYQATFDGKTNARFVEETSLPMGMIERKSTPSQRVATDLNYLAVSLWMRPKRVLRDIGWSVEKMSMEEDDVDVNGVQCRRIRIPRGGPRSTSAIDVDPQRNCVPVRRQTWLDGKLYALLTIDYRVDKDFGPVVNEWVHTQYSETGEHESTRRGRVIRYEINGDIDDSRFSVKFPLGTHVVEKLRSGNRYYIQMPNYLLVPIKPGDFGRTKAQ